MLQCDPRNRSTYHSGQLKVTQRFRGGLQFLGSYTYGKALDYGGSAASGGGAVGNPQTVTNLEAGKGPAGFDVRHRAVVSWVWELPWGANRRWLSEGGLLGAIAGGWQLAGISTMTTGRPFTVFMQTSVNNGATSWPNRIGSGMLDNPTVDLWYNPRDFVAPPPNTYGDTGRGILYGPGHINFDTSLSKRFEHSQPRQHRVPMGRVQSLQPSRLRLPESELRFADGRADHVDGRGQSVDAVFVEAEFLIATGLKSGSGNSGLGSGRWAAGFAGRHLSLVFDGAEFLHDIGTEA